MKKVILTGGTGLIGKEIIEPLKNLGFEIIFLNRKNCDIFSEESIKNFLKKQRANYLLHLAWDTKKDYLNSKINKKYADAGKNLLKYFAEFGGKKAVMAGTCFEYDFKNTPLKESDALNPRSLYAESKIELLNYGLEFSKYANIQFGWGRIFYAFGKNENENRLTSCIINNLKDNKPAEIYYSSLIRDYIYSKDVAGAFAAFLNSSIEGVINISRGQGVFLKDFALEIAQQLNKKELLILKDNITNDSPVIIGDNTKLIKVLGYTPKYDIKSAFSEILENI